MNFRAFRINLKTNNQRHREKCYESERFFTIYPPTETCRFVRIRGERPITLRNRAKRQNMRYDDCNSQYYLLRRRKSC